MSSTIPTIPDAAGRTAAPRRLYVPAVGPRLVVLGTGVALMRIGMFDLKHPDARRMVYWLHVAAPMVCGWLYWLHRLAGPKIRWKVGLAYAAVVGGAVAAMAGLHTQDPRKWN